MLKQLRASTKWIMVAVAVGFVAMMVFDWGMDITSRGRGTGQNGIIARINKEDIPYKYYDLLVRERTQAIEAGTRLTLDDTRRIHDEVWQFLVTSTLVNQEVKRRGITFTDEELLAYMLNNPVPSVSQVDLFKDANGNFSLERYQQFLRDPQNQQNEQIREFLIYVENEARRTLPVIKLQEALAGGVVVSDAEVHERWLREREMRSIDWVYVTGSSVENVPTPTREELQAYYNDHKEDFRHEEQRSLQAVFFPLMPSPADSAEAIDRAKLLVARARNGESFASLADENTEDEGNVGADGAKRGGDLGPVTKGMMIKEFEDVVFALKPGQISEPLVTRYGVHVVTVDSVKYAEKSKTDVVQVSARHILIRIEPSGPTQEAVDSSVKAFHEAVTGGQQFEALATQGNLQMMQTPLFERDAQFIPNLGEGVGILVSRAFKSKPGDVLSPFQTASGFFVIKVAQAVNAGISPLEDVEQQVGTAVMTTKGARAAADYLAKAASLMKTGLDLRGAVSAISDSSFSATVRTDSVNRIYSLPGLGSPNSFMAHVFALGKPGESTGVVETTRGAGIAVLVDAPVLDEAQFETEKETLRARIRSDRQNEIITLFMDELKNKAKIIDDRDVYLSL